MNNHNDADESMLRQLFDDFVNFGLHGRFEETLDLIDEPYIGAGMGEQGIVKNKAQAELVLRGAYRPADGAKIEYYTKDLTLNFINSDSAVLVGEVDIINRTENGEPLRSGLMQTIGSRRKGDKWKIAFTHASPTLLTMESVEAYPIRFMDHTISLLKAGLQAETILYAEINLTKNTVLRLECKAQEWIQKPEANTLEEAVRYGLYGNASAPVEQEYHAFWNRLRLLGLFAEGVIEDHFNYHMRSGSKDIWLRASVEMIRQIYSGDVMAVISFSSLDSTKSELEQFTHRAFHDALTGILNREGFENEAQKSLQIYNPKDKTALLIIDLDDFKQINDRLGHQMGDTVLHQVAGILQNTFQDSGIVGRLGGDEFMVLLTGRYSFSDLEKKAEELLNSMKLYMGGSKQIPVSVSIGIACGHGRTTFEKLYRIADIALYTAKKAGKCRYHLTNIDTNSDSSHSGTGANLLSLQTLLDYTGSKEGIQNKTPYEALLENIPGGVVVFEITDTAIKLTHCNDWFNHLLGYSLEEIAKQESEDPFAFVHPDDASLVSNLAEQIREGLNSFNVVYRVRHRDGHYRHIAMAASTTERNPNSIIMYGIDTDMEEVARLKQEVENEHNRLEALVNSIPGGVVILSVTDRIKLTHCNNWVSRFLGYSVEEMKESEKDDALALVHPDDIQNLLNAIEQMHKGVENVNSVYRLLGKDGTYRHVRNNASLADKLPDKVIYYGVITDVKEMTDIQKKLEYSRKQLEALLTAIPSGVAIFEIADTLKVTQYGTWFYEFTGYSSEEESEQIRQGKQLATVWPEDLPRTQEALRRICEESIDNVYLTIRLKCKNGPPKWVDVHGSVIERTPKKITLYVLYTEPAVAANKRK